MRVSLMLHADPSALGRARTAMRAFRLGVAPAVMADAERELSDILAEAARTQAGGKLHIVLETAAGGCLRGAVTGAGKDHVQFQVGPAAA